MNLENGEESHESRITAKGITPKHNLQRIKKGGEKEDEEEEEDSKEAQSEKKRKELNLSAKQEHTTTKSRKRAKGVDF